MRHQKKTVKLGRKAEHRNAMLANQVGSLILHSRIRTTVAKAKATRPVAEKMVTLGKKNSLHARRLAAAVLGQKTLVKKLFEEVAPRFASRNGGYTRIIKLGPRLSDAAPMALLEWVELPVKADKDVIEVKPAAETKKSAKAKPAEKPAKESAE